MKFLQTLVFSLVALLPLSVYSQSSQSNLIKFNGVCGTKIEFADIITSYSEIPLARGTSNRNLDGQPDRTLVLFINPVTRSWTIAELVTEDIICIIALGQEFEPLDKDGNSIEAVSKPETGT